MSEEIPFRIETTDALNAIMTMREMSGLLIEMKKTHPKMYPGDNELWAKDIEQLAHIIEQQDMIINKMMEINLRQTDFVDTMMTKINELVKKEGA